MDVTMKRVFHKSVLGLGYLMFSTIRKMMEQNNTIIDSNHAGGNKQFVNSNHLPSNVVIFFF